MGIRLLSLCAVITATSRSSVRRATVVKRRQVSGDDGGGDPDEARQPQARGLPLPAGPGEAAVWTGTGGSRGRKRKHECSERQLEAQPRQLLGWGKILLQLPSNCVFPSQ